jgi:hypothetical protein
MWIGPLLLVALINAPQMPPDAGPASTGPAPGVACTAPCAAPRSSADAAALEPPPHDSLVFRDRAAAAYSPSPALQAEVATLLWPGPAPVHRAAPAQ